MNETTAAGQSQPDLTLLSNGNVAVGWTDGPNLTDFDVDARVRIISPTGAAVSAEMDVALETDGEQRMPQVAPTDDGGFVVSYRDDTIYSGDEAWLYQQYDAAGARVGGRVVVRGPADDESAQLLALGDGAFTVVGETGTTFVLGQTFEAGSGDTFVASGGAGGDSNFNPFAFEHDYVADGKGNAVAIRAFFGGITATFWTKTQSDNNQVSDNPDGTPPYPTITGLRKDEDAITQSSVALGADLPSPGFFATQGMSAAGTYLPNGDIAVVWTAASGGTREEPVFSVYAQLMSKEGVILSDTMLIEDQNVQGSSIAPPFVSAGADGQIFVGWTGTTSRNGEGTNEIMGGTFTIPRKDLSVQTSGDDVILGTPDDDVIEATTGNDTVYMLDGDDLWIGGAADQATDDRLVLGMGGDDTFAFKVEGDLSYTILGGSGYDTIDFSLFGMGTSLRANQQSIERTIGTDFDDTMFLATSTVAAGELAHTGGGNDTIQYNINWGGTLDGGAGTDTLTSFLDRDEVVITKMDGYYTIGHLFLPYQSTEPAFVQPEYLGTLRSIEHIQFADQLVTLDATASLAIDSVATSFVPPFNPTGTNNADALNGDANDNTITGLGGEDTLSGGGGSDTLLGGRAVISCMAMVCQSVTQAVRPIWFTVCIRQRWIARPMRRGIWAGPKSSAKEHSR